MRGLITKLIGGQYTVLDTETKQEVIAVARGKFRSYHLEKGSSFLKLKTDRTKLESQTVKLSPKVGDYVLCEINDGVNYIVKIEDRRNELTRPDIVNVDQAFLVFSTKSPDFNTILLDRFLVLIEREEITPVIIVTKIDLLSEDEEHELRVMLSYYERMYDVYYTCSKKHIGVEDIRSLFKDKISVFTGQTGVGKSSLLNALNANWNLKTGEVSKALGRGKHTTRHTELFTIAGGMIADTPGFSSLEFGNLSSAQLGELFKDFFALSSECKYRGCQHINEPGCKVKENVQKGLIIESRYNNYVKFMEEIKSRKMKY